MSYSGKQTTYAGTFIKSQVVLPTPDAEWSVSKVLITTNEHPIKTPQENYMGWFSTADQVLEFYNKDSKTYKVVKSFFSQKNGNNPYRNNAFVLLYYVDVVDATCASLITENIEERLINFKPQTNQYYFKGDLNITSGNGSNKTISIKLTKQPTIDELVKKLNYGNCNAIFEVVEVEYEDQGETKTRKEIKVSSLFAGASSVLNIEASTGSNIDIGGADYLNLIGETATQGTDAVNNENTYFSDILKELTTIYGFNPRTLLTTCILDVSKIISINQELSDLYQDLNENKCATFITALSGLDENKVFNQAFAEQPLYITGINANYTKEKSLYIASAICAGFVSVDILDNERNNPEWSNLNISEDIYTGQKGFSNIEANEAVDEGYLCGLQYMSEGTGFVVRGNSKSWDIAMHSCFMQIVNKLPIILGNLMKNSKNKTKSVEVKNMVLLELKRIGNIIFNNNFLSNEPKDNDVLINSLTEERQREIKSIGWSAYIKPLSQIKTNDIPYEIAICLSGIMASFNGVLNITNN